MKNLFATRLDNLTDCADNAPAGTYEREKAIVRIIGRLADNLISEMAELDLVAPNCDEIRSVEVAMYQYIAEANPLAVAAGEGFGASMSTPARGRVIAQAEANFIALNNALKGNTP